MKTTTLIKTALLITLLPLAGTGCATQKLWSGTGGAMLTPAPDGETALFDAPERADVLVRYTVDKERGGSLVQLYYYMNANRERVARDQKPLFASSREAVGLERIRVFPVGAAQTNASVNETFAVMQSDRVHFTLYRPNASPENFALPIYRDRGNLFLRAVVTPLAVAVDAVAVGAVAAVTIGPP